MKKRSKASTAIGRRTKKVETSGEKATYSRKAGYVNRIKSIPDDQWKLPVGFSQQGELISLEEFEVTPIKVAALDSLSGNKKKELVIERIKQNEHYPVRYMVGVGKVNKETAIEEVQNDSQAGKFIVESEQKVINRMKLAVAKSLERFVE